MSSNDPTYLYYPKLQSIYKICTKSEDGRHRFTVPNLHCDYCLLGGVVVDGEILYVPTEKGQEYHLAEELNVLLYGGRGSAKSTTGRWDCHLRAMAHPGLKYIILRRTYPELEKTHLIDVQREMKKLGGTFNWTQKKAYYPNGSIGFFSHCANNEDVLNLLGAEFALIFFDEVSTFEWEQFTKLASSCRAPIGAGYKALVRCATNPYGPSAFRLMEYFRDKNPEDDSDYIPGDWRAIQANLADNPYLDKQEYTKRLGGLPEHIRRAWIDGEFGYEGALFDLRAKVQRADGEVVPYHLIPDIDLPKILKNAIVYRAIDDGWYPDPTVCLWIAHLGNRHVVFHEKEWYRTTADQVATDIKAEEERLGIKQIAASYCDPRMEMHTTADVKSLVEKYQANGIVLEPSINDREYFATVLHNALAEEAGPYLPRLQIYVNGHRGCRMLARTIPQMRYDDKQTKKMADHKQDHWVVALCYYLMSHASDLRKEYSFSNILPKWMRPKKGDRFVLGQDQVRERP